MTDYRRTHNGEGTNGVSSILEPIAKALRGGDGDPRKDGGSLGDLIGKLSPAIGPQIAGIADYMRGPQVRAFLRQSEDFARRRPGMFVLGAFLVGFAGARFLRSSRQAEYKHR